VAAVELPAKGAPDRIPALERHPSLRGRAWLARGAVASHWPAAPTVGRSETLEAEQVWM